MWRVPSIACVCASFALSATVRSESVEIGNRKSEMNQSCFASKMRIAELWLHSALHQASFDDRSRPSSLLPSPTYRLTKCRQKRKQKRPPLHRPNPPLHPARHAAERDPPPSSLPHLHPRKANEGSSKLNLSMFLWKMRKKRRRWGDYHQSGMEMSNRSWNATWSFRLLQRWLRTG